MLSPLSRVGNDAVASLELMVKPNSELSEKPRVERALRETIASGRTGSLQVDPSYLELSAPQVFKNSEADDEVEGGLYPTLIGPRLWIVIGCVAALIVLAIAQAGLTLYKTSGKTSSHKVGSSLYSESNIKLHRPQLLIHLFFLYSFSILNDGVNRSIRNHTEWRHLSYF
jgi:hypothetical protein